MIQRDPEEIIGKAIIVVIENRLNNVDRKYEIG